MSQVTQWSIKKFPAAAKRKIKSYAAAHDIDLNDLALEGIQMMCDKRKINAKIQGGKQ